MHTDFKLVLIAEIHLYEKEGWQRVNNKIHVMIGGWPSVWLKKVIDKRKGG